MVFCVMDIGFFYSLFWSYSRKLLAEVNIAQYIGNNIWDNSEVTAWQ